jgi:Rieske Fe-S protein
MAANQGGQQVGTITANGIICNCHGSAFDASGNVTQGPAPQALPAYALTLGCDGKLYVDQNTVVANTARLVV